MTIPVTILGGYLGAGKTTILNRLLSEAGKQGTRLGVLINDFGTINLDAALIASQSDSVVELSNGCICCSLADGFASALFEITERSKANPLRAPEHLVIETSGVALPQAVAQYAHLPGFRLDSVVVAADAEQILDQCRQRYVGETVTSQLASADLILLTKRDLISQTDLKGIGDELARLSNASVVPISNGRVDPGLLLGPNRPQAKPQHDNTHLKNSTHFESQTIIIPPDLGQSELRSWLQAAPERILRAKGVAEGPDGLLLLDRVGARVGLRPLPPGQGSLSIPAEVIGKLTVLGIAPLALDWPE